MNIQLAAILEYGDLEYYLSGETLIDYVRPSLISPNSWNSIRIWIVGFIVYVIVLAIELVARFLYI